MLFLMIFNQGIQIGDLDSEKPSEFEQEFFEQEVRVDLSLAALRQLRKDLLICDVNQEIITIVLPSERIKLPN
jgi:hypothetical protein